MFDPTIFDNLKVVLEGAVYDLDAMDRVDIVERSDLLDVSALSRAYLIGFTLRNPPAAPAREDAKRTKLPVFFRSEVPIAARIRLQADLANLAAEILDDRRLLEPEGEGPVSIGNRLTIEFEVNWLGDKSVAFAESPEEQWPAWIKSLKDHGEQAEARMRDIWGANPRIRQRMSFDTDEVPMRCLQTWTVEFKRKINEDQINDITELLDHVLRTLIELDKLR